LKNLAEAKWLEDFQKDCSGKREIAPKNHLK